MTCTGCIYDDHEKNCTHPRQGSLSFWLWPIEACHTKSEEKDARLVLELVRIVNAERARV